MIEVGALGLLFCRKPFTCSGPLIGRSAHRAHSEAVLGSFAVLRQLFFFPSDALGHSALLGISLGDPPAPSTPPCC